MDYLSFEYDGNQIVRVSDNGFPPYNYGSKQYYDYANADVEFAYDANGNMIYDLDRNICAIKYNLLNLPDTIQFSNGNLIVHQYDALGNKYSTTYYTRNTPIVVPVGNVVEQLGSAYNKQHYVYDDNVTYREYASNRWRIERVDNSEGYIGLNLAQNKYIPYYYIKDYLGNVRETYMATVYPTFQRVQLMQYYPSGLPWNETENYQPSQQPFKYGSKEFVEMHGLDEYDSEARWYYPALMRTTTQDPLAEKYYDISPYAWCANNPVNLVDPDGKEWQDYSGNKILDHDKIKVYIFYNSKDFESQTIKMYIDKEEKYGVGSVALSSAVTETEFMSDWENMKSKYIKEININHHGNNQTIILDHNGNGQYITATGNGTTTKDNKMDNTNVQDLPYPKGNILEAQLNLHTCKSNSKTQNPLKGSGLTLLEAFRYTFDFKVVKGTSAGVSYNRFTKKPEPQWFWQKWDYLWKTKK